MDLLLDKLKENFSIKQREILILEALKQQSMGAKEISSKTRIPLGKIYDHLNTLLQNKLIIRSEKKPYSYSLEDMNTHVIDFMKYKIQSMVKAQSEIMDLMKGHGSSNIESIHNNMEFTQHHINMVSESKLFQYISVHGSYPYVMYPLDYDHFIKFRSAIASARQTITTTDSPVAMLIYRSYIDALKENKEIHVLFERDSFNFHLKVMKNMEKSFFSYWKKAIVHQFKQYKIKAHVIDEYLPMQIDTNEHQVIITLRHEGNTNGFLIHSKGVASFYQNLFQQMVARAQPVLPLLQSLR